METIDGSRTRTIQNRTSFESSSVDAVDRIDFGFALVCLPYSRSMFNIQEDYFLHSTHVDCG